MTDVLEKLSRSTVPTWLYEEVKAEIDKLRAEVGEGAALVAMAEQEIERLQAENELLRADAATRMARVIVSDDTAAPGPITQLGGGGEDTP